MNTRTHQLIFPSTNFKIKINQMKFASKSKIPMSVYFCIPRITCQYPNYYWPTVRLCVKYGQNFITSRILTKCDECCCQGMEGADSTRTCTCTVVARKFRKLLTNYNSMTTVVCDIIICFVHRHIGFVYRIKG